MIRSVCVTCVLVALSSIAVPSTAAAQAPGVLVGYNSANINFEATGLTVSADSRSGFIGGFTYNQPVQDMFSVEFDALVSMKGTQFDFGGGDKGTARITYLDVPVLARGTFPSSGTVRAHVLAGPSFNFKINTKFEPAGEDDSEAFETALVFGGGVTVNIFRVEARYGWGLTNIIKDPGEDLTGKNRVFSILFGVELR
jgi:outer membrane protein with beta-barrel domain